MFFKKKDSTKYNYNVSGFNNTYPDELENIIETRGIKEISPINYIPPDSSARFDLFPNFKNQHLRAKAHIFQLMYKYQEISVDLPDISTAKNDSENIVHKATKCIFSNKTVLDFTDIAE